MCILFCNFSIKQIPEIPRRYKHARNVSNAQNRSSNGSNSALSHDVQMHHSEQRSSLNLNPEHSLNFTQQQINAALFNSNSPSYSVQPIEIGNKHYQNQELHMAEILVDSTNGQQRSAFQFDTITPKKKSLSSKMTTISDNASTDFNDAPLSSVMLDSGIELSQASVINEQLMTKDDSHLLKGSRSSNVNEETVNSTIKSNSDSSSDDNGGFITPEDHEPKSHRVKRATVVGNPMFSSTSQDSELEGPGESLGLDDLEMDYDQIMHYFDNLKVNKKKI